MPRQTDQRVALGDEFGGGERVVFENRPRPLITAFGGEVGAVAQDSGLESSIGRVFQKFVPCGEVAQCLQRFDHQFEGGGIALFHQRLEQSSRLLMTPGDGKKPSHL